MSRQMFLQVAARTALVGAVALGAGACARGGSATDDSGTRGDGRSNSDGSASRDGNVPAMDARVGADSSVPDGFDGVSPGSDAGATGAVCTNNGECAGTGTPVCDTTARRCVQCLAGMEGACAAGTICDSATKRCDAGTSGEPGTGSARHCLLAERRCVECVLSDDCAPGSLCSGNRCVMGCNPARPCPSGATCCSGMCMDLTTSAGACGGCGISCDSGQACCNSACTDVLGDMANCGGCGTACAPPHAAGRCAMGMCQVGACEAGWSNLDGDNSNGCECNAGETAPTCEGARALEPVGAGEMREATGIVVRPGSDAWFRVGIASGGFARVRFGNNPGNRLRFEVRQSCETGGAACLNRPEGATGLIDYDFRDLPGEHRTRMVPYPNAVLIRVFATEMLDGCMPFTLVVQN